MSQVKLTIVMILALVFGTAQCVASCTAVSCHDATVPPCHKHHQTVDHQTCGQDFLRPDALSVRDASVAVPVAPIEIGSGAIVYGMISEVVPSPPGSNPSPFEILRI